MKRLLSALVILAATYTLAPSQAAAGVFMCNETGEKVFVAVGYQEGGHWLSRGWFAFSPQQCDSLYLGVPQNRYFYFFANSESWKTFWNGEEDADAGYFCTSTDAFYYNSDSNACAGKRFKRLDLNGADQYTFTLSDEHNPQSAALGCQSEIAEGADAFAKCWMRGMATEKQRDILNCWDKTDTYASFAICANKDNLGQNGYRIANCANQYNTDRKTVDFVKCISSGQLNEPDQKLVNCAIDHGTDYTATLGCAATQYLTPEQQKLYRCVANNKDNYVAAGVCVASDRLTPDQSRIANCVLSNKGSYAQMGVCAVGSNLTPEQQVFASCAISTGGQPYAFAGCVGTQLTVNELQKCMTDGIGGNGCFGQNNTAVKFVTNAFKDVTEGPGPSNDLLGRDGWVGRTAQNIGNDLTYGPGSSNDLVGKDGFVCRTFLGGC